MLTHRQRRRRSTVDTYVHVEIEERVALTEKARPSAPQGASHGVRETPVKEPRADAR